MNTHSEEQYERYEHSEEWLNRSRDKFKRCQVELECARKYGTVHQVATALGTLRGAAEAYMKRLTEHAENLAAYVASELRDQ
jgi:hypothetical protein